MKKLSHSVIESISKLVGLKLICLLINSVLWKYLIQENFVHRLHTVCLRMPHHWLHQNGTKDNTICTKARNPPQYIDNGHHVSYRGCTRSCPLREIRLAELSKTHGYYSVHASQILIIILYSIHVWLLYASQIFKWYVDQNWNLIKKNQCDTTI